MIGRDELGAVEQAAVDAGDDGEAWLRDVGIDPDAFYDLCARFEAAAIRTGSAPSAAIGIGFQLGWIARSMGGRPSDA